ncbi:1-phosphatidylinositol-3-phosphate 5-kinase FAB1 [Apiospora arundinis]|uniref:1-phosphatidylinositol-3-phosphate 5-kinase n=1 Tax=Apiospora arundinis TaxID=335852 RepID=A0ABR2HRX9_9PEZI
MSGKNLQSQLSPMLLATQSDARPRRDSIASASAISSQADKEQLAQALDKIHTSANQRDVLTTFNDLAPPPDASASPESKGFAGDLVQHGFSGLYSRFKEAVGVSGKEKTALQDDGDSQDTASKRSFSTTATASKASITSLPRVETGMTSSTLNSTFSDPTVSTVPSSGILPSEGQAQPHQSTKTSSTAGLSASATSKSASSSRQTISNLTKASATVAPVTVSAYKDGPRVAHSSRIDEGSGRPSGQRKSIGRASDGPLPIVAMEGPAKYDTFESKNAGLGALDNLSVAQRARLGSDGNLDSPISPVKGSISSAAGSVHSNNQDSRSLVPARPSARDAARRPAVIDRISGSRSRGSHSRSSSVSQSTAEPSVVSTSAHYKVQHDSFGRDDKPQRMKSGGYKIPGTTTHEGAPEMVSATLEHMRKQVLSKDFWMADETCKECFLCGAPFTAFRRKHHCRTCGCIFDSRCTSIISGQKFGVQGTLRVCKTCLDIISQREDGNMSDDSADDSYLPAIFRSNTKSVTLKLPKSDRDSGSISERPEEEDEDNRTLTTPMMAIPATRRIGESSDRHSAVLEIDAPQLSRPSSSRSLKSLAGRPQSSAHGHRRHHSKHNFLSRFKAAPPEPEDRAPFRRSANEEMAKKGGLPAFHDDNVIDPDLAPFMSDESSGDEQMSIFQTLTSNEPNSSSFDQDKVNFGPYMPNRRNRTRGQADKSVSGFSFTSRGFDDGPSLYRRPSRRRNMSTASATGHHLRSPRPKSAHLRVGPTNSTDTLSLYDNPMQGDLPRLTRSSSMKGDKEPKVELNPASLLHVRKLLRQLLEDTNVPNANAWEKALIPILLKCTTSVDPDIERGDDIDIRHYVKLKKIPGGRPGDTSYVSGVIFTKKLALKSMPRRMTGPPVVIVGFPIEYRRHAQHFLSLQPVIDEEKEFLRRIVDRLLALRPQLILAEKSVSGLALQYLAEANVAVAYNVKPSVLSAVARCLDTPIISSIDMLSLPPGRLGVGKAASFEVKTFVNEDIPGRKKTYVFLAGSQEQLGCTIALRGAPTSVLSKIKRITEFMVYVVYNLKLESCLMQDSSLQLPTSEEMVTGYSQPTTESVLSLKTQDSATSSVRQRTMSTMTIDDSPQAQDSNGSSAAVPAEPTIAHALQLTDNLVSLHENHGRASSDSLVPDDVPMPTYYSDMVAKYQTKLLSASPFVRFSQPYLLMKAREQERRLVHLKKLRDQDVVEERADDEKPKPQKFQLIKPQMVHEIGQKAPRHIMEVLHAVHDAEYDKALYNYQTQTRQWENYIQGNLDLFEPYAHQNIVVLHSVICTETKIPCVEPGLIAIAFYDEHAEESPTMDPDCTLGQYIEDVCFGADTICTSTSCDKKMHQHHRTYVHGEARITFFIEQDTRGKPRRDNITMWSYCKLCKRETAEMDMSKGTWKYSFGKYLELSFWSRGTRLVKFEGDDAWECPHDHHRDHIRYFGIHDKVVRVHYDPIDLLEIIVPRARITWKVEHDLNLKNEIFTTCQDRWARFTTSVKARLKAIKLDNIPVEKSDACKAEMEKMNKKIQDEHVVLIRKLQDAYMNSKYYEVIPLNVVLREMLEKVTDWDAIFAKFEVDFLPTEKDIRRLTMLQLRKMFTDESKESLSSTDTTTEMSEATEMTEKSSQATVSELETKSSTQSQDPDSSQLDNSSQTPLTEKSQPQTVPATPAETPLERVDPLDLATPKDIITPTFDSSLGGSVERTPRLLEQANTPGSSQPVTAPSTTQPATPMEAPSSPATPAPSASVTEQIEQLRRKQQAVVLEEAKGLATGEGDVVRNAREVPKVSERGSSRRMGLHVSPPMVRAISQPVNNITSVSRSQSGVSKTLFALGKDKGKTPTSEMPPGADIRKVPTNESIKGDKKLFGLRTRNNGKSSIPRFVGKKKDTTRVSTLARHFEQLSREFEKERKKAQTNRAAKMSYSRAILQRSSTRAIVEVYEDPDEAAHEPGPSVDDSLIAKDPTDVKADGHHSAAAKEPRDPLDRSNETPLSPLAENAPTGEQTETDDQIHLTSQAPTDDEQGNSDTEQSLLEGTIEEIAESIDSSTEIPLELPKQDKMNFMKVLTNFWAERSASEWPALDYPLNATDHIFIDSDIIVREDEPSSLIAFALSCEDYRSKASRFHGQRGGSQESFSDKSTEYGFGEWTDVGDEALEASFVRETSSHLKYQFNEGSAKMLVKIFYAEQFDALRRKCGVAPRIVECLSRCLKFDSRGGKTKSVFLKTQDDRLMMKSLSPIETSAFLKFAPSYFGIMAEALFHDLPSVIAKMLGFFQVIIKNPVTNTEIKLDLLLMENLFYDRAPTRIFDLKGSMRNRKIQSTGEQNEVLLDENMVEFIWESPLFAREHSKKLLRASVWNDTLFLARQNVMDYSLMVAVDEVKKELVVGIIDCIRTYTWDKTLESWIKGRGFAGGGRNRPTVTSPKEYKSRFREAMARYILQAPNCWHQFNVPVLAARPHVPGNIGGDEPVMKDPGATPTM